MNAEEFKEFLREWGATGHESGTHRNKIRIKATSSKMIKWLEERVA